MEESLELMSKSNENKLIFSPEGTNFDEIMCQDSATIVSESVITENKSSTVHETDSLILSNTPPSPIVTRSGNVKIAFPVEGLQQVFDTSKNMDKNASEMLKYDELTHKN